MHFMSVGSGVRHCELSKALIISSPHMSLLEALPREFYSPSASVVARELLGNLLLRATPQGLLGGEIVETEAYLANDPACHAFRGPTRRNQVMFGPPGHAYVYFIYGCHFCVNAVCLPEGVGEAVLIRAIEPSIGVEYLRATRPVHRDIELTSGPAKLCQAMRISRSENGADLCTSSSGIWIAPNPDMNQFRASRLPLAAGPRVGITQAASLPLRFVLAGSRYLSRRAHSGAD
jgi:DNA-3-methyladenine glycosylase